MYPERYEKSHGYRRPIIGTSVEKLLRCGDLKYGFARVRCPDSRTEYHVAFSCRQRGCCPSCDQKRALVLGQRLNAEVFADVPHRQWVFTIPRRLRVYFLYDRSLLGKLCRAACETLRQVVALELRDDEAVPAIVAAPQTFGDLANCNSHVHALVPEGAFTRDGRFLPMPDVYMQRAEDIWRDQVFALLLDTHEIDHQFVASMLSWRNSGFSVHAGVRITEGDHESEGRTGPGRQAASPTYPEQLKRCLTPVVSLSNHGLL
ncbi:MAG: hypothetical protein GF331_00235 [Chitinivibrionales bacterium]|nr:hypothetical protein [Chitinivibrionales bacterium]